jgi:hypothetical protein
MAGNTNSVYAKVISVVVLSALSAAAFGARGDSLSTARRLTVQADGGELTVALDDRNATFAVSAPARSALKVEPGVTISKAIYPSFAAAPGPSLPSLELARWRGVAFEEGALAAVELKLEEAVGPLAAGRGGFLKALALKLKAAYEAEGSPASRVAFADAQAFAGTAIALSRADGKVPPEIGLTSEAAGKAAQDKEQFLKENVLAQVPPGHYGWGEDLKRIYLTSLWLGRAFERVDEREFKAAVALVWAVESDPELAGQYRVLAGLCDALAGKPPGAASVADYTALLAGRDAVTVLKELGTVRGLQLDAKEKGESFVFLPALGRPEVELIRRWVAGGEVPKGSWAEAYVAATLQAEAAPAPARDASWPDYMAYAWTALLKPEATPEGAKITWDDGYKARLSESFVTSFDQVRGRAPAAPPPAAGGEGVPVDVVPDLRLEPLPDYYVRTARAYDRLGDILTAALTPAVLEGVRGRREKGAAAAESVAAEAADLSRLFYGFYLLSCADVGMAPSLRSGEAADRAGAATRAYEWLENWRADQDMAADVREAWPLGPADPASPGKGTVYRCVLGVRAVDIEVKYDKKPSFSVRGTGLTADLHFKPAKYTVYAPVIVEVVVPGTKPLTRAQFRNICNENKTEGAIVAVLKDLGKPEEPPPEEPEPKEGKEVDTGMVVLIVVLAVFALIVIIALAASRQRY